MRRSRGAGRTLVCDSLIVASPLNATEPLNAACFPPGSGRSANTCHTTGSVCFPRRFVSRGPELPLCRTGPSSFVIYRTRGFAFLIDISTRTGFFHPWALASSLVLKITPPVTVPKSFVVHETSPAHDRSPIQAIDFFVCVIPLVLPASGKLDQTFLDHPQNAFPSVVHERFVLVSAARNCLLKPVANLSVDRFL
jgi:hypothetical protein